MSLLTILIAILSSGSLAAWVTYALNRRWQDVIFMARKAEDLFISADQWLDLLIWRALNYDRVFKNEVDFNQVNDMMIEPLKNAERSGKKTRMLVAIYFPELQQPFSKVERCRDELNSVISEYKQAFQSGHTDGSRRLGTFQARTTELVKSGEEFTQEIANAAQKLGSARRASWVAKLLTARSKPDRRATDYRA